jgi:2-keto-4-pentenoate hydratase/2-oxohepta-3-ene-1,7-dioic acid hydratase in catechol pathway
MGPGNLPADTSIRGHEASLATSTIAPPRDPADYAAVKAVRFEDPSGETRIGRLNGDATITDAGAAGPNGFVPTPDTWTTLERADGPQYNANQVRLLHPVVPGKILAIGLNYRGHAEEIGARIPDVPVVFAIWSSSLIGDQAPIVLPREETKPDYEGELAVVIGQRTYRADRTEARTAVGGISVFNDVSGRRAQLETPLKQYTLGKSFDTFSPMGPCVASSEQTDLANLEIKTTVSGEVMQEANTCDLIFSVEDLIVYLSAGVTLEPGDVIATGTPGGVGMSREPPRFLRDGDAVEIYVEGVGTLSNPVRSED